MRGTQRPPGAEEVRGFPRPTAQGANSERCWRRLMLYRAPQTHANTERYGNGRAESPSSRRSQLATSARRTRDERQACADEQSCREEVGPHGESFSARVEHGNPQSRSGHGSRTLGCGLALTTIEGSHSCQRRSHVAASAPSPGSNRDPDRSRIVRHPNGAGAEWVMLRRNPVRHRP